MTLATGARTLRLRTGAWYGDGWLELPVPDRWVIETHWPKTPPPLTDAELKARLESPVGQPPIRRLAKGKQRPVIIVDDLTRPTPSARIVPLVLEHLRQARVPLSDVTIVMAKGSHGPLADGAWLKKVGREAAASCRLHVHEYDRELVRLGRTSHGTPVQLNRLVAASDLLIGVGGIYPQQSTGFGGGSKLILGVLGRRSIVGLHYGHPSMAGSYVVDNSVRRDLDEIARMAGLRTVLSVNVDADRSIVNFLCGDHFTYYRDGVEFSRRMYEAPMPLDADVVVSNAYPIDVSLTFMRSKGLTPLFHASPRASLVAISANPEGIGLHRLYPFLNGPRWDSQRQMLRKVLVTPPPELARKLSKRLLAKVGDPGRGRPARLYPRRIVLYQTAYFGEEVPRHCRLWKDSSDELLVMDSWANVVQHVEAEQRDRHRVRVAIYPCSPLQVLQESRSA